MLFFCLIFLTFYFFFSATRHSLVVHLPSEHKPLCIYSNHLDDCFKDLFLQAISNSHKSIDIHTYSLSDETLLGLLIQKITRGITCSIFTDSKTIHSKYLPLQKTLQWKGIPSLGLMHEKILLIDEELSFLGTANMTTESLTMHDNLVIGCYHPSLCKYLKQYTREIEKKKKQKNQEKQVFDFPSQTLTLWMLPFKGSDPLEALIDSIHQAKKSLFVSMFTFTHPKILRALVDAHKKGILVKVFLDQSSFNGASHKAATFLMDNGLFVSISQGLQLLHHKMMLIDEETFILGSANWTQAAFKKNHDFYLSLTPLTCEQSKLLKKVFNRIEIRSKS